MYNTYVKKIIISKLFLYRYRFIIGYIILGMAFIGLLFLLPFIAQNGISRGEINSATASYYLGKSGILNGNLVDLPYHLLQKLSIIILGITPFSIKLPSIIVGLFLGLLLILLLNRWFKNNVSLLASCLIVLSTPFLFLAGSGTPLIMLVFWPTLLLWLGSKIQGEKKPKICYVIFFTIAMLLSIFTPYMIYFAVFCVLFIILQPSLRIILKKLPKILIILIAILLIAGFVVFGISVFNNPQTILELLFAKDFHIGIFISNISAGITPLLSWQSNSESVFLSPLISLPVFALALIGLFSTTKGFFASRNSIASILIVFCLIITGFNPDSIIFIILPLSILVAHGLKYLLEKWYGLFPENPYARISAIFPLTLLFGFIIIPGLLQYIYGYRYNPNIANEFNYNLEIIRNNLHDETLVVSDDYDFYNILSASTNLNIINQVDTSLETIAILNKPEKAPSGYALEKIITSPMRENSDIIYLYTKERTKEGE